MINKIDIFGTTYKVKEVPELVTEGYHIFGEADNIKQEIKVAINVEGVKQSDKNKEITLMHEIVHCILMEGQYLAANQDEPLVEWIAKCLISLKKQGVFK